MRSALLWLVLGCLRTGWCADAPLDLRLENLTVMPSTGPVVNAWARNATDAELTTTLRARWPAGWQVTPAEHPLRLEPGQVARVAYALERAADREGNRYEVTFEARVGSKLVTVPQTIVVATAPSLKPRCDGQLDDWRDAVPIAFETGGRATTVLMCWNRERVGLAVRVHEDALGPGDAVQFALAPARGKRWEFLVVAPNQAYLLLKPTDDPALTEQARPLAPLACAEVEAAVTRAGQETCYEVLVPTALVPELRPTTGRLFRCSVLVHDRDGTGLRDLGSVMNLWPTQRQARSWCRWPGAAFGTPLPFDPVAEFGFSSSIH